MGSPSLADAALLYARCGWPVFPIRPREKRPLTQHGLNDATCDVAQVEAWWQRWPQANVAIRTGAAPAGAGLVVLDVDGPAGEEAMAELDELPQTLEQRTGSGSGRQLVYRLPPHQRGLQSAGRLGSGLDTRGESGYVLLPPSVHPSGGVYTWTRFIGPARAPGLLIARPRPLTKVRRVPFGDTPHGLERLCAYVGRAAPGQRNDALFWAACRAGEMVGARAVSRQAAEVALERAAHEAYGAEARRREIENTIRSGLDTGVDGLSLPQLSPRLRPRLV